MPTSKNNNDKFQRVVGNLLTTPPTPHEPKQSDAKPKAGATNPRKRQPESKKPAKQGGA